MSSSSSPQALWKGLLQEPPPISQRRRQVGRPFAELTMACLRVAGPHASMQEWRERIALICDGYGERAVYSKLRELQREGFLTDGRPITGFLTEKGRHALQRGS